MKVYFDNWSSLEEMCSSFGISEDLLKDSEVIYASYETPEYEGSAHVIYLQNGKLYEVGGSHCSCYGLEGQWEPEETNLNALLMRELPEQTKLVIKAYFKNLLVFL